MRGPEKVYQYTMHRKQLRRISFQNNESSLVPATITLIKIGFFMVDKTTLQLKML